MHVQNSENFCSVFERHIIYIMIPHKKEEGSYACLYRCKIPPTHFKGVGIRTFPLQALHVFMCKVKPYGGSILKIRGLG
jgi:hypothetical protein